MNIDHNYINRKLANLLSTKFNVPLERVFDHYAEPLASEAFGFGAIEFVYFIFEIITMFDISVDALMLQKCFYWCIKDFSDYIAMQLN